ncbi:hypothetical protein N7481_007976 [Penicillium waksmanii]|uniref:uncharacterized protein n=1 Tax=Penicillium waksmanii TaxID=69791 RepID=UPI002549686E|nr:uncharacterized protein N7481_007976 [Penicillium waksmanii]KAJ5980678.1 hypothetical protein N7481_007976 [Penicillium waksmanii]
MVLPTHTTSHNTNPTVSNSNNHPETATSIPPKYRCPRCSTRTCSLPCTRRHKLWSQCSGVRDPAAYLKRSELATASAFDRDFNFISGIERSLERAERDAENRGIDLAQTAAESADAGGGGGGEQAQNTGAVAGQKRKHPGGGLVKGEAGFLRGAEAGGVRVVRAPRGMSRNKANGSRWHPKHKCLSWSVEWISASGEKVVRNCLETGILSEAYNRAFALPKEDRPGKEGKGEQKEAAPESLDQSNPPSTSEATPTTDAAKEQQQQPVPSSTSDPVEKSTETTETKSPTLPIGPHRDVYFYIHRPQTKTKKPVVAPLPPSATLGSVLRERTVLEFPTIYALPDSVGKLGAENEDGRFILEEEYLRTADPEEICGKSGELELPDTGAEQDVESELRDLDEKKVMEVLTQDLFEPVPEQGTS